MNCWIHCSLYFRLIHAYSLVTGTQINVNAALEQPKKLISTRTDTKLCHFKRQPDKRTRQKLLWKILAQLVGRVFISTSFMMNELQNTMPDYYKHLLHYCDNLDWPINIFQRVLIYLLNFKNKPKKLILKKWF